VHRHRRAAPRRGTIARPGFTLIEVLFVLLIVGIVGGIAIPRIGTFTSHRGVNNARDAFIRTGAQARAAAIQTGNDVEMRIDPANDRVTVVTVTNDTIAVLDLRNGPIQADLSIPGRTATGAFLVCYVPRGYARPDCGGESIPKTVRFVSVSGKHTAEARILLTQVERR
jgi:prepilin-type N-terminal cleavage/methylation domain-containing protein